MLFHSTRGSAPRVDFETTILRGLAPDGGLYLPVDWPRFDVAELKGWSDLSYAEVAARVIHPFAAELADRDALETLTGAAFANFAHPEVAPIIPLGDLSLMELFWGPTLAFKDFGMQVLARLVDLALERRDERLTIIGATSGDTGSAAIEAFRDRDRVDIVILYPRGRVTSVQRRQMTTVASANVHAVAVDGTFDDCQDLIKSLFADPNAQRQFQLSTANSINFGRLAPQIAYYVWGILRKGRSVSFAVPSGNFGNAFSGHAARAMTGMIDTLILGANRNHVLVDFIETSELSLGDVCPTVAPSMDIQIPSNLERLLFELFEGDGPALGAALGALRSTGRMTVAGQVHGYAGSWYTDDEVLAVIANIHSETGVIVDPHTAIGVAAGRASVGAAAGPIIALATAHPAKFPDVVNDAVGSRPDLPPHLADLYDRPERLTEIPNSLEAFHALVDAVQP